MAKKAKYVAKTYLANNVFVHCTNTMHNPTQSLCTNIVISVAYDLSLLNFLIILGGCLTGTASLVGR